MRICTLIWTNLRRHRLRAFFGIAGIAFGVAAMLTVLAVVTGAIGMFRNILESDSQYLVFERNVSDLFFSSVPEEAWERIAAMPEVAGAYPVLFGIVRTERSPVITCFGLEADNPRIRRAEWLQGGPEDFGREEDAVYLGERAAGFLHAGLGDTVVIGNGHFRVAGVLRTENGFEDGGVFFPLPLAQRYFRREGLASIVAVSLREVDGGAAFQARAEAEFPGLAALANEEFGDSYSQFRILSATGWAVGLCAFLLGGLSVANTMTLSVFTRIREIAVLRVCGFSRRQVAGLILGEGVAVAAAGAVLGLLAGFFLLLLLERLPLLQGYVRVSLSPAVVAGILATAFLTSLGGSLYPAWFAARIQPAEALRYE